MRRSIFLIVFALSLVCFSAKYANSQESVIQQKNGVILYNKPSFRHFAILMQDTISPFNRFDNWFDEPEKNEYLTNPIGRMVLPAFIIDSTTFFKCEEKLLHPDSTIKFNSYPKYPKNNNKLKRNVKKYIRLYIGYIDSSGHKKVIVQFITPGEYRKMKEIYTKGLFLIANQKKLRFATIKL